MASCRRKSIDRRKCQGADPFRIPSTGWVRPEGNVKSLSSPGRNPVKYASGRKKTRPPPLIGPVFTKRGKPKRSMNEARRFQLASRQNTRVATSLRRDERVDRPHEVNHRLRPSLLANAGPVIRTADAARLRKSATPSSRIQADHRPEA